MKLFLDTNVLMDLLGERHPHYDAAAKIATLADKGKISIAVSAVTFTTLAYILPKYYGKEKTIEKLRKIKIIVEICDLSEKIIEKGLNSEFSDFEDSVQYYSALKTESKMIITRNTTDYKKSTLPVLTPDEFLESLSPLSSPL